VLACTQDRLTGARLCCHVCMQTFRPHKEKQGLTVAVSPELLTKRRALTVGDPHAVCLGHTGRGPLPAVQNLN
jgi:hypothetical protein